MQERCYESGSCAQLICAILGVHPTTRGTSWEQNAPEQVRSPCHNTYLRHWKAKRAISLSCCDPPRVAGSDPSLTLIHFEKQEAHGCFGGMGQSAPFPCPAWEM